MRGWSPFRESTIDKVRIPEVRILSSDFLQMISCEDLVAIVALVPIVSYSQVGSEFGGVEVLHACCNGGVDDGRLIFNGVVSEARYDDLET